MGWGSTADPLSNVAGWMKFKHKDDAIAFCHRQGWRVTEVNDANEKTVPQRNYGDNYSAFKSWCLSGRNLVIFVNFQNYFAPKCRNFQNFQIKRAQRAN